MTPPNTNEFRYHFADRSSTLVRRLFCVVELLLERPELSIKNAEVPSSTFLGYRSYQELT